MIAKLSAECTPFVACEKGGQFPAFPWTTVCSAIPLFSFRCFFPDAYLIEKPPFCKAGKMREPDDTWIMP
jgi:hypothetical protein